MTASRSLTNSATQSLPDWANWRDEAFGFTYEPAVMVYNRDLVPELEVPRSRNDLIRLIREYPARYNRRVATYDAATSGIGYLFATQDFCAVQPVLAAHGDAGCRTGPARLLYR